MVRVRDQWWTVTEVRPEPNSIAAVCHTVSLLSVEDDSYGAELTVLWQVEPGREIIDHPRLPDPKAGAFDHPTRLDAFLHAVRWGAVTSADAEAMQAPFRSGIEIEDYQLAPLVRALNSPRANLLIADDVGLGKTIEAGLVAKELLLRHRARTVLVVCPPSLCHKWQVEMLEKFGLEFRILNSDAAKRLRRERGFGVNPFTHFPRLIVSVDWMKLDRQVAVLDQVLPPDSHTYPRQFDLLIVDEIHTCAPAATKLTGYAVDSLRTKLVRHLVPHFEHRLFLSATPHNGYDESFQGLLELLDPLRFAKGVDPKPETLGSVMIRRLKSEISEKLGPRPDGSPRFPKREVLAIEFEYPDTEAEIHEKLRRYGKLNKGVKGAASASNFMTLLLKKRLLSSPRAFRNTLDKHRQTMERRTEDVGVDEKRLREAFARVDDDHEADDAREEAIEEALDLAARALGAQTEEVRQILKELQEWATTNGDRPDAKIERLIAWLGEVCRPAGKWNDERVIVFTEYRDTLHQLHELLVARGFDASRIELIYGGMDTEERQRITTEFQYDPRETSVRILLATDAASEGIDLQNYCHRIVHVEIPFSPTRLEQRNGRVDRYGQRSPVVEIRHFVGRVPPKEGNEAGDGVAPVAEADSDFLSRVAEKVSRIRAALGSANPILERQIQEALLGERDTFDEAAVDAAVAAAPEKLKRLELDLEVHVARLRSRLNDSMVELEISPEAVEQVVKIGLDLGRQHPLTASLENPALLIVPDLDGIWARTIGGLMDPVTGRRRLVTFDVEEARDRADVVHLHLGHPLVTASMHLLRAQVWSNLGNGQLSKVSIRRGDVEDLTVVSHGRIVITGADGARLHEQVVEAAGVVRNGRYRRLTVGDTAEALRLRSNEAVKGVDDQIVSLWAKIEDQASQALTVRAKDVAKQKERALEQRRDKEIAGELAMGNELVASIRQAIDDLDKPDYLQLSFGGVGSEEKQQFELDLEALRRRVTEIPDEIQRHAEILKKRYQTKGTRVFPVAITFVVPDGWEESR